jgi:hypothetical protein
MNQVQSLLVQSCDDLVNSDGTLTQPGETAVGCIRNGVLLGLGGLSHWFNSTSDNYWT